MDLISHSKSHFLFSRLLFSFVRPSQRVPCPSIGRRTGAGSRRSKVIFRPTGLIIQKQGGILFRPGSLKSEKHLFLNACQDINQHPAFLGTSVIIQTQLILEI